MEIALIILIGVVILVQAGILLLLFMSFNHRGDNDPNLKYFTHEDFDDLEAEAIQFPSGKHELRGFIYRVKGAQPQKLMIFNMGIGAGHQAYTHVIRRLAQMGYLVLAYDYTGCQLSHGKRMKGLPQALKDFQAACRYVEERDDLRSLPLDVVGHSWGGYVTGIAPRLCSKIRKAVIMSGFNSVPEVVSSNRPILKFFSIFIDFADLLLFGKVGLYDVISSLRRSRIPMLFIAGAKDPFMKAEALFTRYQLAAAERSEVEFYLAGTKSHNPYLTEAGEAYFIEVLKKKRVFDKHPSSDESQAFYRGIDYELITQNDEGIYTKIQSFLENRGSL